MNARFNLPDFVINEQTYGAFVDLTKEFPEVLLPNTEISAIFGIFPGAIWNGGGINTGGNLPREEMERIIDFYNFKLHLPLRFTFTNLLIEDKHLDDTYCNIIAEIGNNGHNQILVANPRLENYLRKHYKNYKYCRSIVGARDIPYQLHGNLGDYYLSVMQRRMNNNWEFLDKIPEIDRPQIEFLCTDPCPDNCPRLYTHYRDFARCQLEGRAGSPEAQCSMTEVKGPFPMHYLQTSLETYISRDMINNEYLPRGYQEFKCSGRNSIASGIKNLLVYCVKPEYEMDMYYDLLAANGIN